MRLSIEKQQFLSVFYVIMGITMTSPIFFACSESQNTNPSTSSTTDSMDDMYRERDSIFDQLISISSDQGVSDSMIQDMTQEMADAMTSIEDVCPIQNWNQSQALSIQSDTTQIHPDTVWDGEAFWITWNIANEERKFEVWAGRFNCQLEPLVEPFAVEQSMGMNDLDPSIAVVGNTVAITWSRDDSYSNGSNYNLSTRIRFYDKQTGQAQGDPQKLELQLKRTVNDDVIQASDLGNFWMVDILAHPQYDGFIVAGAWGDAQENTFKVYVQLIDTQGGVLGHGVLADANGSNQVEPKIMLDTYGYLHVLWKGTLQEEDGFYYTAWRVEWNENQEQTIWTQEAFQSLSEYNWVSADIGHLDPLSAIDITNEQPTFQSPWLIGSLNSGVVQLVNPNGDVQEIGPNLTINAGTRIYENMVTSYQKLTGTQYKLWYRLWDSNRQLSTIRYFQQSAPIAPYPLSVEVLPHAYFIVWAQGMNPDFELYATFVER